MSPVVLSRRIRPGKTAEKACDAPEEAFMARLLIGGSL